MFIVAADREVLEEALDAVEQATPVREEEPYYSSASEFLDKIFQHQFSLPPLRTQRLTGFARELVEDRGGLWADLRAAEPNGRRLAAVMYALIPPHVRSPRRVKVLLNNFATNVRVSEARGIDWLSRATEIAMLTVLQTEFPRLAADLHHEPRLPSLLLDPPDPRTERQQALITRHGFAAPIASVAEPDDDEVVAASQPEPEPPDRLLAGRSNAALRHRQREDLRRYLTSRKAAGVPDPGRDLLYLEAAGEPAGLDDPELGQLIEEYAADEPARVIAALDGHSLEDRAAAARLLGLMSEKEAGPERVNMVTALAGALEGLMPAQLSGRLGDLLENIASYQAEEELVDQQLPGVLTLAEAAGPAGQTLAQTILRTPALLATPARVSSVSALLPVLSDDDAIPVEEAVVRLYLEEPGILLALIENCDAAVVDRLIRRQGATLVGLLTPTAPPVAAATPAAGATAAQLEEEVEAPDDTDEKTELLDQLLERLATRGHDLAETEAHLLALFLREPQIGYDTVKRHAPVAAAQLDAPATNTLGLAAIAVGPPSDWEAWASTLTPGGGGAGQSGAAIRVLAGVADASTSVQSDAPAVVERILQSGNLDDAGALVAAAEDQLAANDWWDTSVVDIQILFHRLVRTIAATAPDLADALDGALVADVRRSTPSDDIAWDADVAEAVVQIAAASSDAALGAAVDVVAVAIADDPSTAATRAAITLSGEQAARGLARVPLPATDVAPLISAGDSDSDRLLSTWLATQPPSEDVLEVLAATNYRPAAAPALSTWADGSTAASVVKLFGAVLDSDSLDTRWLSALRVGSGISEELAELVAERMASASAAPARERAVEAARALSFGAPRSRRAIAGAALLLLTDTPNKSKSDVALALIQTLDSDYGGLKGALRDAALAVDAQGLVTDRARKRFEQLGLVNKKRKKLGPFTLPG